MKTRLLGRTGISVSELCFGTMSFGGDADEAMSTAMYKACREAGINFFDCADAYAGGKSEEILGRLAKGHRDELVLTTKCFNPIGPDANARGLSRRHIVRAVEASLRRLQTDRVDVLFLHQWDQLTPIEESIRALEDLVRAGKVIYPAISNWAAWQIQRAIDIEERQGWARLQVIQPMYNLVKRQAEVEILPMAEANGLGVMPYSPAAAGLLSGKYFGQASGRLRTNKMYEARYGDAWMIEVAERYVAFCRERGLHPVSTAIAWVGAHPAVTAPIIGARNLDQLKDSLAAVEIAMTPGLRAEIADLSRAPPPATDRSEEQKK
ncbi:Predicted oxidoreductase [Enhydrobacter aerosaccus]|uniref:Predicted oxidoreductase n=1 Tax=Enhydrobacter aerosaccus TaxID=225324 RepID=A0A1T4LLS7_9HYPH|nr:aldo/keto reductase [Enhydrobacter aerosaccus]SJZ55537.1 Predicted oxidoreductase [Enhydrobacter aerosaccus]